MRPLPSEKMRRVIKRLVEGSKTLRALPEPRGDTQIDYYELTKKRKGLGVPQDNRYARVAEALTGAQERRHYQGRV